MNEAQELRDRTITDFGDQWTAYRDNEGYYASVGLLLDILGPFAEELKIRGGEVADIGSGSGRIVRMLIENGAKHVTAVEPSDAYDVLVDNTRDVRDRVTCIHGRGESLPGDDSLDAVVSFGVLHHIPDPSPVVARAFQALKPGGKIGVWLYGREGNELYLGVVEPIRKLTTKLPHRALEVFSAALDLPLVGYAALCRFAPLPMADYMRGHLGKLSKEARRLTIYDQLNPAYAKYYSEAEARSLLETAGFVNVRLHHRHGYSWTVVGEKPTKS